MRWALSTIVRGLSGPPPKTTELLLRCLFIQAEKGSSKGAPSAAAAAAAPSGGPVGAPRDSSPQERPPLGAHGGKATRRDRERVGAPGPPSPSGGNASVSLIAVIGGDTAGHSKGTKTPEVSPLSAQAPAARALQGPPVRAPLERGPPYKMFSLGIRHWGPLVHSPAGGPKQQGAP